MNQFNTSTLFKYVMKFKFDFFCAIIFNILFSLIVVGYAEMFRVFFDNAQVGDVSNILSNLIIILFMIVFQSLIHYISSRRSQSLYLKLRNFLQKENIHYVINGDVQQVRNYHTGELLSISLNDTDQIAYLGSIVLIRALHIILKCIIFIIYLLSINVLLGMVSLIFGPILLLIGKMYSNRIEQASNVSSEANAEITATASELFQNVELFKINETKNYLKSKLDYIFSRKYKSDTYLDKYYTSYDELSSAIGQVANVTVLSIGAYLIAIGNITTGTLVAFMQIVNQIIWPLVSLNSYYGKYNSVRAKFGRIDIVRNFDEHSSKVNVHTEKSALKFTDVSFSYENQLIFNNISFEIGKGEFVLLVGENGVGKSTLMKLISGLFKPQEGKITYNELDYGSGTQNNVNYVMQSNNLFMGTIKENIDFNNNSIKIKDMEEVFTNMSLVNDFEQGLDTKLSQNSDNISGGQKQKLSLLRGFLKEAKFVLFDESLSAIDVKSKSKIKDILRNYIKDKTCIMIDHNFDMLEYVDSILYIDTKGNIYKGNHNVLMNNKDYNDLYCKNAT